MKLLIDTDYITNVDALGEMLRTWAFKEEFGCYSCFDLINHFTPITDEKVLSELRVHVWDEEMPFEAHRHESGLIVAWQWDGDGILMFGKENDFLIVNSDCKKDYGWERIA